MPELTDYIKKDEVQDNVEGCFNCQQCNELVESAHLDSTTGVMIWKCSNGHVSMIEGFK